MTDEAKQHALMPAITAQAELPIESALREVERAESTEGLYTGVRLAEHRPHTYQAIIQCLSAGMGVIRISRQLHVHIKTVEGVRDREGHTIAIVRERLAREMMSAAELVVEGIREDVEDPERRAKIGTRDKAIIAGILIERGQVLSGGATSRLEIEIHTPEHDDFNRAIGRGGEIPQQRSEPERVSGVSRVIETASVEVPAPDLGPQKGECAEC
jgi:hypothetical protein